MKKINILWIFLPFLLASCGNWLDVQPSDQVDEDKLFNSGTGYRTALNGIYKDMSVANLWGEELSWGLSDVLAQSYDRSYLGGNTSKYNRAARYLYEDKNLEPVIQSIWSSGYNVIANCNNLLKNISQEDTVKFQGKRLERDMIHGEALALRALMHFELLRFFAPSLEEDDNKPYIPYFSEFPSIMEKDLTVNGILEKVENDLLEAKKLLATVDLREDRLHFLQTENRFRGGYNLTAEELFLSYRGFRMNYTAVMALLARVYSFAGELEKAYEAAAEVIDFVDGDGQNVYTFTEKTTFNTNPKRLEDLVFALSSPKLVEFYAEWNKPSDNSFLSIDYGTWYDMQAEDPNDYRWSEEGGWLSISEADYWVTMKQYTKEAAYNENDRRIIPVIRLSEMYYIQGEYLASVKHDYEGAAKAIEQVSVARGCTTGKFRWIASEEDYREAVLSDARKEFFGEGQLFHFYKKYNIKPYTPSSISVDFVFPKPDNEKVY